MAIRSLTALPLLVLSLHAPPPAAADPTQELIELVRLEQEIAFDIEENRRVMRDLCAASVHCLPFADEMAEAVAGAGRDLRLGPQVRPILDEMFELMDDGGQEELFAFFRSAAGRRVLEAEAEARTPELRRRLAARGAELYSQLTDERIFQLEAIDARSDAAAGRRTRDAFAVRVVEWLERRAKARGLAAEESQVTPAPDRTRHTSDQLLALTYMPLADEELQQYVDFLATDAAENWSQVRGELRRTAVRQAAEPILLRLVERLGED